MWKKKSVRKYFKGGTINCNHVYLKFSLKDFWTFYFIQLQLSGLLFSMYSPQAALYICFLLKLFHFPKWDKRGEKPPTFRCFAEKYFQETCTWEKGFKLYRSGAAFCPQCWDWRLETLKWGALLAGNWEVIKSPGEAAPQEKVQS